MMTIIRALVMLLFAKLFAHAGGREAARFLRGSHDPWTPGLLSCRAAVLLRRGGGLAARPQHPGYCLDGGDGRGHVLLAAGKARTGRALGNPVLSTEGRVTLVDSILASAVLAGLALHAGAGLWRADPLAALVIVFYARREARAIFLPGPAGVEHSP